jgi:hypothetical protein
MHEGIADPRRGCPRWPEHLRLLNERTGELHEGRCKATNLCRYCQRLYVIETVEMLLLDALQDAPTVWVVLTAREHLTRAECRGHLQQLRRAARKRWPNVEWFVQVEFQRRGALHLNLLVKGVPREDAAAVGRVLSDVWCRRVDAAPVGQWCEEIDNGPGALLYISKMLAHGLKAEQSPPLGWRGHRTSQTRGYFGRGAAAMREEARRSLREKRLLFRAIDKAAAIDDSGPPPAALVELVFEQLAAQAEDASWALVHVNPSTAVAAGRRGARAHAPASELQAAAGASANPGAARAPSDRGPTVRHVWSHATLRDGLLTGSGKVPPQETEDGPPERNGWASPMSTPERRRPVSTSS